MGVMLNNTASHNEHKKDIKMANRKKTIKSVYMNGLVSSINLIVIAQHAKTKNSLTKKLNKL